MAQIIEKEIAADILANGVDASNLKRMHRISSSLSFSFIKFYMSSIDYIVYDKITSIFICSKK